MLALHVLLLLLLLQARHHQAKMSVQDRSSKVQSVIESLERDMQLLCLTGVEDKLQDNVRPTLEMLKNAGIKVRVDGRIILVPLRYTGFVRGIQTHGKLRILKSIWYLHLYAYR